MDVLRDLWRYFKTHKKYWLLPVTLLLAILGAALTLASGSALAPFIYTIF